MKSINPLHIGILLVVMIAFLFMKLSQTKEELITTQEEYSSSYKLAHKLSGLKSLYADKVKTKKELRKILKNSLLKNSRVVSVEKRDFMKISADKIDLESLNYLMSKILNGSFIISMLRIEKINDKEAALEVEIKW